MKGYLVKSMVTTYFHFFKHGHDLNRNHYFLLCELFQIILAF